MLMTLRKVCEFTGWDFKKASDDRANGADFIPTENGRVTADQDDCAAAFAYMDARNAGQPVKVAGATACRLREAMRRYPAADQLTVVALLNGSTFAQPTDELDLSTGYISGGFILTATMFDVRNLRDRVRQAVEGDPRIIGAEDE